MRLRGAWLAFALLLGCNGARSPVPGVDEEAPVADTSIIAAQEALTREVMGRAGVTGTAIGLCDGEPCIKVYLTSSAPEVREGIPTRYRGFTVDVEVTGELRARGDTTR